jgi:hypothetical protein
MLKKIFIVLLIIIAFLVASVYVFRANIKNYAIQTILKSFPLPNVALANVHFDETTGKLNLEEIKVKNPKGFMNQYILEADSVDMDISFATKPQLRLNINEINIDNPVFYLERSGLGKWNFQEFPRTNLQAFHEEENRLSFIKEVYAAEGEKKTQVILPRTINIGNGSVHFFDNFIRSGEMHQVDLLPIAGVVTLDYVPSKNNYNKISFDGSCNVARSPEGTIKGNVEFYPMKEIPSYKWDLNAYNVPLATIGPYLDQYTPFIVTQGRFNLASNVRAVEGEINGDYTMELMDLAFAINPNKSNIPFLETSVKKLSLYLTNQRGNVVIDFKQKGTVGGKTYWTMGPIAKRAIGLMAIDTVLEVIDVINKGGKTKEMLPSDIPPEVIDIFKGILR